MVQTIVAREAAAEADSSRDAYLEAYRGMLLARILDDKFASLYRGGKIHGGVYLGRGQEALSVSVGSTLRPGDVFAPLIRDAAGRIAFGENILDAIRTYLGSPLGPMRARDGNVHRGDPRTGLLPMLSHLGSMIPVVNGVLLAKRFQGITDTVGATCLGEGGTSTGAFHEAMNQAAVEKLPLIMVVANNQYAYSTPTSRQFACHSLVDKAIGYGVAGHEVEGNDLTACLKVMGEAVTAARNGGGPQLVVARLLRLCGHGEHDDSHYIDPALRASPLGRDCLKLAEDTILERGWAVASTLDAWRADKSRRVEEAVAMVQREAAPDPYQETWCCLSTRHLSDGFHEA